MAKVFISHATKTFEEGEDAARTAAREIRDLVCDGLEGIGHSGFLDQRCLPVGSDWRATLHRELGRSHAAVLLADPEGIKSDWLRKEAIILDWRRSLNRELLLITVRVGGVTSSDLKRAGIGDLTRWQGVKATGDASATAQQVLDLLAGHGPAAQETTPMGRWINVVAAQLKDAGDRLELAADALGLEPDDRPYPEDVASGETLATTVARELMHAHPDAARQAVRGLAGMPREALRQIVAHLESLWVDTQAAAVMHGLLATNPRPTILINADDLDVGQAYVNRALGEVMPTTYFLKPNDVAGEGGTEELMDAFEAAVSNAMGQHRRMPAHRRGRRNPIDNPDRYLLLGRGAARQDLLQRIRQDYARTTIVLLPGVDSAARAHACGATLIEPELDEDALDYAASELDEWHLLKEAV